jgi:hypothetical protein
MPIVVTGEFDLLDIMVLLCCVAPSKHHSLEGWEHGRTIPLADPGHFAFGTRVSLLPRSCSDFTAPRGGGEELACTFDEA